MRRPNGYLYRCREPHTAQAGWEPETTAAFVGGHPGQPGGHPGGPHPCRTGGWSTSTACTIWTRRTARSISAGAPGRRRAAKSSCNTSHTSWWGSIFEVVE